MATPNMGLIEPTPGVGGTPGPEWASDVNTNFETIDAHDHAGTGAPIPSAGLAIDADLSFNGFDATSLHAVRLTTQSSNPSQTALIFVKNGELTYIDSSGNVVPLTSAGSVAGATGSISGLSSPASAVFSAITNSFSWLYDSAKSARMASADLIVYPYDGVASYSNAVTIKVPTAIAAAYSLTLPLAVPTQDALVGSTTAGVLSFGIPTGSAAAPGAAFNADLNTGLYSVGADQLGLSTGGTLRVTYSTTAITSTLPYLGAAGTAAAPNWSFSGDSNTGMYSIGADQLGLSTGGTLRLTLSTTALTSTLPLYVSDGTAGSPSVSFGSDTNTGMYNNAADVLGFSTGGSTRTLISSSGISSGSSTSTDQIKWKVFTGTVTSSGTADLAVPSGSILSCIGHTQISGGATRAPITIDSASFADRIGFTTSVGSSSTTQRIFNRDAGNSNTYRIVMFYQ